MFARDELGKVARFLVVIPPAAKLVDAKIGMGAVGQAD